MTDGMKIIGLFEEVALPSLGVPKVLAKVDTGATLSVIDAINIKRHTVDGVQHVAFDIRTDSDDMKKLIRTSAPVVETANFQSSNGDTECRFVVAALIVIGDRVVDAKLALADRNKMQYRMLLGAEALAQVGVLVDPA